MKKVLYRNRYLLITLAATLIFFGIWEVVAFFLDLEIALPTFSSVVVAFFGLFTKGSFYLAILFSMLRCLIGYIIGYVLGAVLGLIAGRKKGVAAALRPFIVFMRTVPVVAIILVLAIWLGSEILPSVVGIMLVMPVVYEQIRAAAENIDSTIDDVLAEYGTGFWTSLRVVYLPLVVPHALSGISSTSGMNIKAVISAEILVYTVRSIGYNIYYAKANFLTETPTLFAWIIVVVILSIIVEAVLKFIAIRVTKRITWLGIDKKTL